MRRWYAPVMLALAALIAVGGAVVFWLAWSKADAAGRVGADLGLYVSATNGWLHGSAFYPAHQLAGPYAIADGDILYPPTTILLFLPFLALPAVLFWLIPLGVLVQGLAARRPAPWTWPLIGLCLAYPPTMVKIVHANPFMWSAAAVSLGLAYGWPSVFALLKPSLAPFALIGLRRRSWWIALGGLALVGILFGGLWGQYWTALLNSRNPSGLLYSISDVPLLLVPIIGWLGRRAEGNAASKQKAPALPIRDPFGPQELDTHP